MKKKYFFVNTMGKMPEFMPISKGSKITLFVWLDLSWACRLSFCNLNYNSFAKSKCSTWVGSILHEKIEFGTLSLESWVKIDTLVKNAKIVFFSKKKKNELTLPYRI